MESSAFARSYPKAGLSLELHVTFLVSRPTPIVREASYSAALSPGAIDTSSVRCWLGRKLATSRTTPLNVNDVPGIWMLISEIGCGQLRHQPLSFLSSCARPIAIRARHDAGELCQVPRVISDSLDPAFGWLFLRHRRPPRLPVQSLQLKSCDRQHAHKVGVRSAPITFGTCRRRSYSTSTRSSRTLSSREFVWGQIEPPRNPL
jgi:hypothetical protein